MRRTEEIDALAAGYEPTHRVYEWCGVVLATCGGLWLAGRISLALPLLVPFEWLLAVGCGVGGMLSADFVSGFFHWLFDTWGAVDTPIVGALAIRTFRHHHVDPDAMTQHDFVETNGHNFALALVPLGLGLWVSLSHDVLVTCYFASFAFFVAFTSQIHKWAHVAKPPPVVRAFQRARLLLAPAHHAQHHLAPHDRGYCVTVGWLNTPLRALRLFEGLERGICFVTGAVPRRDTH